MEHYEILIIGAGAAGISAAKAAYENGCRHILLVEHNGHLGGILHQCAHHGFGDGYNGPEYIQQLFTSFPKQIQCRTNTTVLQIHPNKTAVLSSADYGEETISFDQLILATGSREIPLGALEIAGTRPTGIYTAGQMQEMMNVYGVLPESPVVILGSGDLGLIMAQQIAQCGKEVTIVEKNSVCGGLERNQIGIKERQIPVKFQTTIAEIHGTRQLEAVTLESGEVLSCKTLLIAVGLVPNQELISVMGHRDWIHVCGNCNRVHTMIESVVHEGKKAGITAWETLRGAIYD